MTISLYDLFMINESTTRGHNFILYKPLAQTTIRKHFFSIRVINNWKSLPYEVVNAVSLDGFKSKLDNAWEDNLQNQAKLLHTIGLVLSTNSSSCMPFTSLSVILRVWKKKILQWQKVEITFRAMLRICIALI